MRSIINPSKSSLKYLFLFALLLSYTMAQEPISARSMQIDDKLIYDDIILPAIPIYIETNLPAEYVTLPKGFHRVFTDVALNKLVVNQRRDYYDFTPIINLLKVSIGAFIGYKFGTWLGTEEECDEELYYCDEGDEHPELFFAGIGALVALITMSSPGSQVITTFQSDIVISTNNNVVINKKTFRETKNISETQKFRKTSKGRRFDIDMHNEIKQVLGKAFPDWVSL